MRDRDNTLEPRALRLIRESVEKLALDLSGLVVLTEAASGNYIYTPLICAAAGCESVLAATRDSLYAPAREVIRATINAARIMRVEDYIRVTVDVTDEIWRSADIVTNLGFLRPIDREAVSRLKPTAAVPLMFESWKYREEDLDLRACWERGICVLGTNEELGTIRILDYLGMLVAKKLFERGIEIRGAKTVVIGKGKFLPKICETLQAIGAIVVRWLAEVDGAGIEPAGAERLNALTGADAIVVAAEPNSTACIVGRSGPITVEDLVGRCPDALVVQLAGTISRSDMRKAGIRCIREDAPQPGHMGWPLSELGPKPVIDLHAAGLKVGELLARARLSGLSPADATAKALESPVCQDFSPRQKRFYGWPLRA